VATIEWLDDPSDDDLVAAAAIITEQMREVIPGEPPYPAAELRLDLREQPDDIRRQLVVGRDRGEVVATAVVELTDADNQHVATVTDLMVTAGSRRQGIASQLLDVISTRVRTDNRRVLVCYGPVDAAPATALATARSARPGLVEHQNRMHTAELDRSLLERWIDQAAERATDYSIVSFDDRCPDDLVDAYAHVFTVMNSAPRTETFEDFAMTAEQIRQREQMSLRRGHRLWAVCARHDPSGELVGFTEIFLNAHRPWLAEQDNTGVDPIHRDKGLGRWIKAVNALRLLDEHPEVEIVETWNADVNAPMLAINDAMGFRCAVRWQEWEIEL
jgi:mycothiol synthase